MTATAPKPRTAPTAGLALWWLIPPPVRAALRCRVPLDARTADGDCLIVAVGSGAPLRWLMLEADPAGGIAARLWEVRAKVKEIARATTTADQLPALLQRWAGEYKLGE